MTRISEFYIADTSSNQHFGISRACAPSEIISRRKQENPLLLGDQLIHAFRWMKLSLSLFRNARIITFDGIKNLVYCEVQCQLVNNDLQQLHISFQTSFNNDASNKRKSHIKMGKCNKINDLLFHHFSNFFLWLLRSHVIINQFVFWKSSTVGERIDDKIESVAWWIWLRQGKPLTPMYRLHKVLTSLAAWFDYGRSIISDSSMTSKAKYERNLSLMSLNKEKFWALLSYLLTHF